MPKVFICDCLTSVPLCIFAALSAQATDTETRTMEVACRLAGMRTGSESETAIETWTEKETEKETESGTGTETETETGAETGTANGIERGTETEAEKGIETGTGTGSETETESGTEMDRSEVTNQLLYLQTYSVISSVDYSHIQKHHCSLLQ